ncbi:MAG: hypothetical protein IT353_15265 [Gemmatimonadaceae bacterium]|nr:hypothetical protein [Gemmatimonadaceae bacterium]
MFDQLRESLRTLSDRLAPEERRRVTASMRDALMHAKLGISDLRDGVRATESRLASERAELETVRRRQGLAAQIQDAETVAIAERFSAQHAERVAMLETKLMVQQQELAMVEREYEEMSSQLRLAMSGIAPGGISAETAARQEVDALLRDDPLDPSAPTAPAPRRTRAEKEAEAESRLAELKRRMGK